MSDETTPRLKMPMIVPGQAQKELSHNDALATLDLLVQGSVVEAGLTVVSLGQSRAMIRGHLAKADRIVSRGAQKIDPVRPVHLGSELIKYLVVRADR